MVTRLAHCVMVQGTSSHVGKSVIATALCRVLREEGYAVAPFKAQNMSLNAAATPAGGEIGRAQAVQAEAAGVAPRAAMNPILLKPEADSRSQLVVLGRHRRTVEAREYWTTRGSLWPVVRQALGELRREFEVIVIEAGSPAEVNLARGDLANTRGPEPAARACCSSAITERGGICAQVLGTIERLAASDRPRVRGLIVNKFRGDPALFSGGVRYLAGAYGLPVLGVLPWADDLGVAPEDALSLEAPRRLAGERPHRRTGSAGGGPDIAILRLPHLSNFDEFVPLASAGAAVRYVADPGALAVPDLVIVPGSKTTIADRAWLSRDRSRRAPARPADACRSSICGGYQMLGLSLADPDGVEGRRCVCGLGCCLARPSAARATIRCAAIVSSFAGAALERCRSTATIHPATPLGALRPLPPRPRVGGARSGRRRDADGRGHLRPRPLRERESARCRCAGCRGGAAAPSAGAAPSGPHVAPICSARRWTSGSSARAGAARTVSGCLHPGWRAMSRSFILAARGRETATRSGAARRGR